MVRGQIRTISFLRKIVSKHQVTDVRDTRRGRSLPANDIQVGFTPAEIGHYEKPNHVYAECGVDSIGNPITGNVSPRGMQAVFLPEIPQDCDLRHRDY